jgi:hypothetical protein
MDRTPQDEPSADPQLLLDIFSREYVNEEDPGLSAIHYYRCMRDALEEEAHRWLNFGLSLNAQPIIPNPERGARLIQYLRYLELFELEIAIARKQRREAVGSEVGSSEVGSSEAGASEAGGSIPISVAWRAWLFECLRVSQYRAMLRLAAVLFRVAIPGSPDLCDAAASGLFRLAYPYIAERLAPVSARRPTDLPVE